MFTVEYQSLNLTGPLERPEFSDNTEKVSVSSDSTLNLIRVSVIRRLSKTFCNKCTRVLRRRRYIDDFADQKVTAESYESTRIFFALLLNLTFRIYYFF